MSKSLTIIRHAKADWPEGVDDFDRPLHARGITDAKLIAGYLANKAYRFDSVLCSSSLRTRQTCQLLQEHLMLSDKTIFFDDALYLASLDTLLKTINKTIGVNKVAIIAHNPGVTELCNYLTGDTLSNLPTCAIYTIDLVVEDWLALDQGLATRTDFTTPKTLKNNLR